MTTGRHATYANRWGSNALILNRTMLVSWWEWGTDLEMLLCDEGWGAGPPQEAIHHVGLLVLHQTTNRRPQLVCRVLLFNSIVYLVSVHVSNPTENNVIAREHR